MTLKQESPIIIREVLMHEFIILNKCIVHKDYKKAKLSAMRIHSLCDALIKNTKQGLSQ